MINKTTFVCLKSLRMFLKSNLNAFTTCLLMPSPCVSYCPRVSFIALIAVIHFDCVFNLLKIVKTYIRWFISVKNKILFTLLSYLTQMG